MYVKQKQNTVENQRAKSIKLVTVSIENSKIYIDAVCHKQTATGAQLL